MFVSFDELLKCFGQFSFFSTKRTTVASAAKLTILFCEIFFVRRVSGIGSHRVYNHSTVVVKRAFIQTLTANN